MAATLLILWNGFSEATPQIAKEMGMDKNVGVRPTTFVRCRIAIVTVVMRCRVRSRSPCTTIGK